MPVARSCGEWASSEYRVYHIPSLSHMINPNLRTFIKISISDKLKAYDAYLLVNVVDLLLYTSKRKNRLS